MSTAWGGPDRHGAPTPPPQAAAVIGCDRTTLHRVIAAGRGPRIFRATPRGRARIWRPHLDEWMAAGGANGLPAATEPEPDPVSP